MRNTLNPLVMRLLLAIASISFALSAHAASELHVSHLQHLYAGGGACAERFWLYWDSLESEITDIEIVMEVNSKGQPGMTETLRLERLGYTTADSADEASIETPQCLLGKPRLTILSASGIIQGMRVDLVKGKMLKIGRVKTFPLGVSGPTHPSNGSARNPAQTGEVRH